MIVVSDTSPLNYLILIGAVDILPNLFGEVIVPSAVLRELQHPRTPFAVKKWVESPPLWLRVHEAAIKVSAAPALDPDEAEAIDLALQLHADAVLIDEKVGRQFAKERGIAALGTLTVLELAAERELVDLQTAFESLEKTTFHVTPELLQAALDRHLMRRQDRT